MDYATQIGSTTRYGYTRAGAYRSAWRAARHGWREVKILCNGLLEATLKTKADGGVLVLGPDGRGQDWSCSRFLGSVLG